MDTTTLLPSKSRTNIKVGSTSAGGTGAVVKDEGMERFMDRGGGEEGVPASKSMATLGPFGSPTVTQCVRVIEDIFLGTRCKHKRAKGARESFSESSHLRVRILATTDKQPPSTPKHPSLCSQYICLFFATFAQHLLTTRVQNPCQPNTANKEKKQRGTVSRNLLYS